MPKEFNPNETIVYDRAVSINTKEDVEAFLEDPHKFLESVGALEGLPGFNGIMDSQGNKIESPKEHFSNLLEKMEQGTIKSLKCGHLGIPYSLYCIWECGPI